MERYPFPGTKGVCDRIVGKFIVDTSVWIDFFRGHLRSYVHARLFEGIKLRVAAITDIIRHEILVGAKNKKQFKELRNLLSPLDCIRLADKELSQFDEFAWNLKKDGFKGKYTDAAIAFICFKNRYPLFTFDRYFKLLARKGILRLISF